MSISYNKNGNKTARPRSALATGWVSAAVTYTAMARTSAIRWTAAAGYGTRTWRHRLLDTFGSYDCQIRVSAHSGWSGRQEWQLHWTTQHPGQRGERQSAGGRLAGCRCWESSQHSLYTARQPGVGSHDGTVNGSLDYATHSVDFPLAMRHGKKCQLHLIPLLCSRLMMNVTTNFLL